MRTERCDKCRFWATEDGDEGLCQRYPPSNEGSTYPVTKTMDWCGEFFPADNNSLIDDIKKTGRVPGARY